jgi:hypothetical protein
MRKFAAAVLNLTILAAVAAAAGMSGLWRASQTMPDGSRHESTIELREDAGKLVGTISSKRGKVEISEGSASGGRIAFTVVRRGNGDELHVEFAGTVEGDTMKLKMQYRDHGPVELTARRVPQ